MRYGLTEACSYKDKESDIGKIGKIYLLQESPSLEKFKKCGAMALGTGDVRLMVGLDDHGGFTTRTVL